MARAANKNKPIRLAIVLVFEPHELNGMKRNEPGPSGLMGGYPRHENRLLDITDPQTRICSLGAEDFIRTVVYCKKDDTGGPNSRIRAACIPALRRAGIDVRPEWRAPSL